MRPSFENIARVRVTHVLWAIWDLEFGGDTHFHIWRKVRSTSGQKRSNFETQHFLLKTYLSCPVLSKDSKNHLFCRMTIRISKKWVSKNDVITSLNCVHLFLAHNSIPTRYFGFKDMLKIFCRHILLKNQNFNFGGPKTKNFENRKFDD